MSLSPLVLLTPSRAAAVELPRRVASSGRAIAGVYALKPLELARALAEPVLLGRGLAPWTAGHDALLAARLLREAEGAGLRFPDGTPLAPVAGALAHTLAALHRGGVAAERLSALATGRERSPEDAERLAALARLLAAYQASLAGRTADPATLLAAAREGLDRAGWLTGASVLVADDLELEPDEHELVRALAERFPVRILRRPLPAGLRAASFRGRLAGVVEEVDWPSTTLAPAAPSPPGPALLRLRESLFEPPAGDALGPARSPADASEVELVTAPGEAAEVRSIVRRLLREAARGVPFEQMGVVLPRPESYAPLFTDLLERLNVPHRLHPSLPLRFGRAARSLLLLFRCRELERPAVMEFLTFAPVPWAAIFGAEDVDPSRWDHLSKQAGIVSGYSRWLIGLRSFGAAEREAAEAEADPDRRARRLRSAADADALLRAVEILNATLDGLAGEAAWPEWVARLRTVVDQWIGPERDQQAVLDVIADLGGLGAVASRAAWREVESVLEARFEWERLPLDPVQGGAVHIGALDAIAGLPFRVVAIPGLVEGGYPGVFRPDPFLLDAEREALRGDSAPAARGDAERAATEAVATAPESTGAAAGGAPRTSGASSSARSGKPAQLSLFTELAPLGGLGVPRPSRSEADTFPAAATVRSPTRSALSRSTAGTAEASATKAPPSAFALPTTQDRLVEARRQFHRACSQASERLVLSYPRADARSGRERLPSLFFAAVAAALAGRPVAGAELDAMVIEDDPLALPLDDAVDRSERDRFRVRRDPEAATQIAAGSAFFQRSLLATKARNFGRLSRYDGLLGEEETALSARLDPRRASFPVSASRFAVYARCGFQYLLQHVLKLSKPPEPEERRRIEPLERGDLFHKVAESFLRERRDRGELPLTGSETERARLRELAEQALERLVEGNPPRFTLLWEREKRRFHETLSAWLARECVSGERALPLHFELSFGMGLKPAAGEPHDPEPLEIDLGEAGRLRVSGRIDRLDRRRDGQGLVLRDYKTGRAPKDDGGTFRGGRQLQMPFYVLAAQKLFPGEPVLEAFLDYVDGGRQVGFRPELVTSPAFRELLAELVTLVTRGVFAQDASACEWCDFTMVCGPRGLIERRTGWKLRDPALQAYLRLRDVG